MSSPKVAFKTPPVECIDKKTVTVIENHKNYRQKQQLQQKLQLRHVQEWVSKFHGQLRQLLSKYLKYSSSPARQDAILKTVQYTLWFLSHVYPSQQSSLSTLAGEISWTRYMLRFFGLPQSIDGAYTGSWGLVGIKSIDGGDDDDTENTTPQLNGSGGSGDGQTTLTSSNKSRFSSLLSLLDRAITNKRLGQALAWTMLGYFPLEHVAYLQWKVPGLRLDWNRYGRRRGRRTTDTHHGRDNDGVCLVKETPTNYANKLSAWSCRFWLAYLVLDILRSARALYKIKNLELTTIANENETNPPTNNDNDPSSRNSKESVPSLKELQIVARQQKFSLSRSLLYVLPAIHWSLPNWDTQPWLSDDIVNGLCWIESLVGLCH